MSRASVIVNKLLEADEFDARAFLLEPPLDNDRRIRTSYSRITPESAEEGENSDSGWLDEEGESMEVDPEWDEEGTTPAQKAADWLKQNYAAHASSSHFNSRVWYSTGYETIGYTGEEEERSFHLSGFTPEEEQEIFDKVIRKI